MIGEELPIEKEENNNHNEHAVAVLKSDDVVGHMPCTITRESWFLLLLEYRVFSVPKRSCGMKINGRYVMTLMTRP